MSETKLRVKLRRPEQVYTVVVVCDYEKTKLGEIKALAEKQVKEKILGLDLIEVTPVNY
jgi:hypothetical protein